MSTKFDSVNQAVGFILSMCKYPVKREDLQEDPDLKVYGMETGLLDDPSVPEEEKNRIRAKISLQRGFRADTPGGELKFVVGPFRDGFDCWIVNKGGFARRL